MDRAEVQDWIIPPDYDHAEAEAKHLIYESDADKVRCDLWIAYIGCAYVLLQVLNKFATTRLLSTFRVNLRQL